MRHELAEFLRTTELARSVSDTPERIVDLILEIPNHHFELGSKLSRKIDHATLAIAPLRVRPLNSLPDSQATIGSLWEQVKNQSWELQTLSNTDEDLSELREFIHNRSPYLFHLYRELRKSESRKRYQLSNLDIHRITTPLIVPTVKSWNTDNELDVAVAEIHLFMPIPRYMFQGSRNDLVGTLRYSPLGFREYRELNMIPERSIFGPYEFSIQTDTRSLSPTLENRFPNLHPQLEKLGGFTPDRALAWASSLQVSEIRRNTPRFLGAEIRGEHLGFIGPVVIVILQVYLLLMLYNLLILIRNVREGVSLDISWILLMKGWSSMAFSVCTLILLPAIATGLSVWRLTPTDWYVWIGCTLTMAGIGAWIAVLGREIRNGVYEDVGEVI